jgi:hypothetical protein
VIWLVYDWLRKPTLPTVPLDITACKVFILVIITEMYLRLRILKPFGEESLRFAQKQLQPCFIFSFEVEMSEGAAFDEASIAEMKAVIQGRINERLFCGKSFGIPYVVFGGCPSLVITDISVAGNKYIFEVVWVNCKEALDYVNSRMNTGENSHAAQPYDDLW